MWSLQCYCATLAARNQTLAAEHIRAAEKRAAEKEKRNTAYIARARRKAAARKRDAEKFGAWADELSALIQQKTTPNHGDKA